MKKANNSLTAAVGSVALFTMISRVLALAREIELSSLFGTTGISDAYLLSQSIPVTIFSIIAVGVATTFIPSFNKVKSEKSIEDAELFTNNCSSIIFLLTTFLVILIEIFPSLILQLFAPGLSKEIMQVAIRFLRISAPSIYFIAYVNIFSSYLRIKGLFYATTIIGIPLNVCLLLMYYLAYRYQIEWLAISVVVSNGIQFLMIIFYVLKTGHKFKIYCNFRDPQIRNMVLLSIPIIISTGFDELNLIVDKNLASSLLVAGGISVLYYANVLISTCHSLISVSVNTVIFPQISNEIATNNSAGARLLFCKAVHLIELFILPILIWIFFFSNTIISVVYGRGEFDEESIKLVATCLIFYGISLPASGIRNIILDIFYSKNNTLMPMINGVLAVIINIVLNLILSNIFGLCGLAVATSASTLISTCLLGFSLKRVGFAISFRDFLGVDFLKIIVATLCSVFVGKGTYLIGYTLANSIYMFIPAAAVGIISYFVMMIVLKDNEIVAIWNKVFRRK